MKTFCHEGHRVAYRDEGTGPPVLLLHNAGNDHRNWAPQIEALAEHHRVIALDLLGFGASDRPERAYDLPLFAGLVGACADALQLDRLALVGHCVGGAACWQWALDHAPRVTHLALLSPATLATMRAGPYGWLYRAVRTGPIGFRAAETLARATVALKPTRWATVRAQFGRDGPDPAFAAHCEALYNSRDNVRVLGRVLEGFETFAALDHAGRPDCPVLLAWGTANRILPFEASAPLRASLRPDMDLVLDGRGHLVMQEAPDEISRTLGTFLACPSILALGASGCAKRATIRGEPP